MGICTWDRPLTSTWEHVCGRMSFSIYLGMGNLKLRYFSSIYSSSLSHAGNSGHLSWMRLQLHQEQRYPLLPLCAVFLSVRQWHGCQCLGYLTCAQMLMHAIAGRGCTKTSESWPWAWNLLLHWGKETCVSGVKVPPTELSCCLTPSLPWYH